jgi:hypothetical protein
LSWETNLSQGLFVDPSTAIESGALYNKLMRQSATMRWMHVVLAIIAAGVYESQRGFSHYAFWRSSGGAIIAMLALPVWPYAVSCSFIWSRTTTAWVRPWIFGGVLVVITILVSLWYLSHDSVEIGLSGNFTVTLFQTGLFGFFARWTFDDSFDDIM